MIKKLTKNIALLSFCLCGCAAPDATTFMTYNIQIGRGMDKAGDLTRTAAVIRRVDAETVVLNEVDVGTDRSGNMDQAAFIAEKTGYHYLFGKACLCSGGEYGNVVMSKYPVEKIDLLDLPSNQSESRSALVVKIHAPTPYYVIGLHLTFERALEDVRVECVELLTDYIRQKNLSPVLIIGDLNALPNDKAVSRMRENGFTVINDIVPNECSWPADNPEMLLDYMAFFPADAATILEHDVIDEPMASDHRPVWSKIQFQ